MLGLSAHGGRTRPVIVPAFLTERQDVAATYFNIFWAADCEPYAEVPAEDELHRDVADHSGASPALRSAANVSPVANDPCGSRAHFGSVVSISGGVMNHVGPYWNGVMQRLQAEVEQMNQLIAHQGAKGTENELSLARLVEHLIPTRFGVGSGLLVDSNGKSSKQMDLVVYERGNEPAIFAQTNQVLFPVENVRLCIEVKTTLTKTALEDGREKKASIEALHSSTGHRPPLALFGYGADIAAKMIAGHLDAPSDAHGPRPDMTASLLLALLVGELPGRQGWTRAVASLHQRDALGNIIPGTEELPTDEETTDAVRHGVLYPLVAVNSTRYVVAEPSRSLLLLAEWIVHVLHDGHGDPVLSAYIDATARELTTV